MLNKKCNIGGLLCLLDSVLMFGVAGRMAGLSEKVAEIENPADPNLTPNILYGRGLLSYYIQGGRKIKLKKGKRAVHCRPLYIFFSMLFLLHRVLMKICPPHAEFCQPSYAHVIPLVTPLLSPWLRFFCPPSYAPFVSIVTPLLSP